MCEWLIDELAELDKIKDKLTHEEIEKRIAELSERAKREQVGDLPPATE